MKDEGGGGRLRPRFGALEFGGCLGAASAGFGKIRLQLFAILWINAERKIERMDDGRVALRRKAAQLSRSERRQSMTIMRISMGINCKYAHVRAYLRKLTHLQRKSRFTVIFKAGGAFASFAFNGLAPERKCFDRMEKQRSAGFSANACAVEKYAHKRI